MILNVQSYCILHGVLHVIMKLCHMICILFQDGSTALHYATLSGKVSVVEELIRLGAEVNALDVVSKYVCDEVFVLLVRSTIQCSNTQLRNLLANLLSSACSYTAVSWCKQSLGHIVKLYSYNERNLCMNNI